MSESVTRVFLLPGGLRRDPAVEAWLQVQDLPMRALAKAWFQQIRNLGPDVRELLHDGHPTACINELAFAYVNAFTAHVNIGFYFGSVLPDPDQLLQGSGKFMRHVKVAAQPSVIDLPLQSLLRSAYADAHQRQSEHAAEPPHHVGHAEHRGERQND